MAFLYEVGKALGKASQGLSDAKNTISSVAQETRDNIARERLIKSVEKETEKKLKREKADEQSGKCPKCGQPLNGISAVCPSCGYELRNVKVNSAVSDLAESINKLNQRRHTVTDAISAKISGRNSNPTDERIASLIQNFVVPNTKEDIFEFMILAAGYMDASFLAGKQKASEVADIIIKAWASKFDQTYQKACFTFGKDKDFPKIQALYDRKMHEIEEAKQQFQFSLFRRK